MTDRFTEICQLVSIKEKEILTLKSEAIELTKRSLLDKEEMFKEVELCRFFESVRTQINKDWTIFKNDKAQLFAETKFRSICVSSSSELRAFWNWETKALTDEHENPIRLSMENFSKINISNIENFVKKNIEGRSKIFKQKVFVENVDNIVLLSIIRKIDLDFYDFQRFGIELRMLKSEFDETKKKIKTHHIVYVYNNPRDGKEYTITQTKKHLIENFGYKEEDFDKDLIDTLKIQDTLKLLSK